MVRRGVLRRNSQVANVIGDLTRLCFAQRHIYSTIILLDKQKIVMKESVHARKKHAQQTITQTARNQDIEIAWLKVDTKNRKLTKHETNIY